MMQQQRSDLYNKYKMTRSGYDEWFDEGGAIRRHCAPFSKSILDLNPATLNKIWTRAQRNPYENGIVYNVFNESKERYRSSSFDPVPLIVSCEDWLSIEKGLQQRAHALNLLAIDLYGSQRIIREKRIPNEVVFANPAFVRIECISKHWKASNRSTP